MQSGFCFLIPLFPWQLSHYTHLLALPQSSLCMFLSVSYTSILMKSSKKRFHTSNNDQKKNNHIMFLLSVLQAMQSSASYTHLWFMQVHIAIIDVMRWKVRKVKRAAVARSQTQDTFGLSHQYSATEPRHPDNHQLVPTIFSSLPLFPARGKMLCSIVIVVGPRTGIDILWLTAYLPLYYGKFTGV